MAYGKRVKPAGKEAGTNARPAKNTDVDVLPRARKSLGQNFLSDRSAAQRIVDALGELSDKTVLEIGPGRGALTDLLIPRTGHLIAIELDRVLAAQLRMKYANATNVEILEADFLDVDLASLLGPRPGTTVTGLAQQAPKKIRAVGNIPYYITSDILLRIFDCNRFFESVVIMVQQEVADRIVAKPGTSDYGLLSATCQLYARVEKLFSLPPEAFSPAPKVHSAVLRLSIEPGFERLEVEPQPFMDFLKLSFAQKRKTLANNLKQRYPGEDIRATLNKAKVRPDARAESLSLEKAAAIFRSLGSMQR